jgi:hypothetical protein
MKTGGWLSVALVVAIGSGALLLSCSSTRPGAQDAGPAQESAAPPDGGYPGRDFLINSENCRQCHQTHYDQWAHSVHAYASDDPVFVAMNKRGQRETDGGLGDFCVKCHAPMAVMDGKTSDGLNLAELDPAYHGVTCFFCHAVDSVIGTHNAALSLSSDLKMRGEYSNPIPNAAHDSTYSNFFNRDQQETSQMCGACHDIVVRNSNAFIERTFCEWSNSAYGQGVVSGGQSCIQCHMYESQGGIAQAPNAPIRLYHAHDWPGVDVPLNATDGVEQSQVQQFLATSFHGALCVTQAGGVRVIVDPAAIGHGWPSGAAQDRRAWAEVVAYSGGNVVYQSGVVADGKSVMDTAGTDADLWLLRDQMFDSQNNPVSMFWQAASTVGNEIPPLATFNGMDPAFYNTHVMQTYPRSMPGSTVGLPGGAMPDRVTFRLRLQPIGLDVLNELVDSGDLEAGVSAGMPTYDVSFLSTDGGIQSGLEWTPAAAAANAANAGIDRVDNHTPTTCVATNGFNAFAQTVFAPTPASPTDCTDAGPTDVSVSEDAGADADAGPVCDPRFAPDTIAPGLTKKGNSGNFTFVITSAMPQPPEPRWDTWVVKILDKNGQPVTNATLKLDLPYMPLHMHPTSVVSTYTSNNDGTYTITQFLFMAGNWQVTIHATSGSTTDSVQFEFCAGG